MSAGSTEGFPTLAAVLAQRAAETPDRQALVFLEDGVRETSSLTYAELHLRAGLIAAALREQAERGARALLLFPPGLEFVAAFFGCLYAGMIAVPAYPPRQQRKTARLTSIFTDARPALILGTGAIIDGLRATGNAHPEFAQAVSVATDLLESAQELMDGPLPALEHDVAFLQYTSGSTSTPKGVMVTHGNLVANSAYIQRAFGLSAAGTKSVSWLPSYHDMGLIDGLLQPIYTGFPGYLLPSAVFFQQPMRWLEAIDRFGATHCGGPDFAYSLCVRTTTPEQRRTLDLSRWSSAYNGAEPVRATTLDDFADAFAVSGFRKDAFYPCYGMAETTLMVTGASLGAEPIEARLDSGALEAGIANDAAFAVRSTRLVSSGHLHDEMGIAIVDPASCTRCADGRIGEIWVSGPSVAAGYWGRPEQTRETFGARLQPQGQESYLRTGDLGFLRAGELYVTGRLKDVIILRGRNHYPQDIELTAETSHAGLRRACNAAFTVEQDGQERLVIVQEVERTWVRRLQDSGMIDSLRRAVALEHGVQPYAVVLLAPGRIFKTSSGKIQRRACREAYLAGSLDALEINVLSDELAEGKELGIELKILAPEEQRLRLTVYLQEQVGRLLGLSAWSVDLRSSALELGLDSLGMVRLRQRLESDLGVALDAPELFQGIALHSLVEWIAERLANSSATVPSTDDKALESSEVQLSRGQRALWFLHRIQPKSSAYNVAFAADVLSEIDEGKFAGALEWVIKRHPALRSRVVILDGEPRQQVLSDVVPDLAFVGSAVWDERRLNEDIEHVCETPFDLDSGRPLRVRLYRREPHRHTLLIVAHHIVVDFASLEVVLDDLTSAYAALQAGHSCKAVGQPAPLAAHPLWQESFLLSEPGRAQLAWWVQRLSGSQPALALPHDRPKEAASGRSGDSLRMALDGTLMRRIRSFARGHAVTPYILLLTSFMALLRRYSGQPDISLGTSVEGRERAEWAHTVGYLANQVVLRCSLDMQAAFTEWLRDVQRDCQAAWAHQQIPLATVVEALRPERTNTHSPLFDVMFGLVRASRVPGLGQLATQLPGAEVRINGLPLASRALHRRAAQFDLMLTVIDAEESLVACWEFSADLFTPDTIERIHRSWISLLTAALDDPARPVTRLPLLTDAERSQLLVSWNDTVRAAPRRATMHELFEAQVRRTPQRLALSTSTRTLSYADLNHRANWLARRLQAAGARPGTLVGICLRPEVSLVEALLAVLKTGAAYVPLDPMQPTERLGLMLADATPGIVLTQAALVGRFDKFEGGLLNVEAERLEQGGGEHENLGLSVKPEDLAYVMYTSGSTGSPKGVMVTHAGLTNYLTWAEEAYEVASGRGSAVHSSFGFDATLTGLLCPLLAGGEVLLLPEESALDALALLLRGPEPLSLVKLTPAHLEILKSHFPPGSLPVATRTFVVGGEALTPATVEYWRAHSPLTRIFNEYGPTETVVGCCVHEVTAADAGATNVSIGRPIANMRVYVLDAQQQLLPVGVVGEIYIGGVGVAGGYLNRRELTAERFLADPFCVGPWTRMYRTGDLGRWLPNGELQYLGRNDLQVKIRGYRVELGEVEAALLRLPPVHAAAVTSYLAANGDRQLLAHVVCAGSVSAAVLRTALERRLPQYMIPGRWTFLSKMPLTANGKVDRRSLENTSLLASEGEIEAQPRTLPVGQVQEVIAAVWREVLGIPEVGIHDNFFDVGGHSLLVAKAHQRLIERLDSRLTLLDLYQHPTIHALEQRMTQPSVADGAELAALRERARHRREGRDRRRERP